VTAAKNCRSWRESIAVKDGSARGAGADECGGEDFAEYIPPYDATAVKQAGKRLAP